MNTISQNQARRRPMMSGDDDCDGLSLLMRAAQDGDRDAYRTLLRENLRKSVDERLLSLAEHQALGEELQRAVRAGRKPKS